MTALDLSSFKQPVSTGADANKLNNGYDAIQAFVNSLPIANIAGYPASSSYFLRGDGTWATGWTKVTVSAWAGGPPASPADQDVWVATAVDANGTRWTFQYNASGTIKWELIGGPPSYQHNAANVAVNALTQVGATAYWTAAGFVAVRAGDYFISGSVSIDPNGAVSEVLTDVYMGTNVGTVPVYNATPFSVAGDILTNTMPPARFPGVTAGATIGLASNVGTPGTNKHVRTHLTILPIRVT